MAIFELFSKQNRNNINKTMANSTAKDNVAPESANRAAKTAIIYQSELDYISRCILDYTDIETGGQLFGYWTSTGVPVVMYVIGPGEKAQHNHTFFIQDQKYLQLVGNELHKRFRLQHIGEWHSHHQLGLAHPSGGDVSTMQYGIGKPGFPRLLLCIGNCTRTHTTVNPFNFHENSPKEYEQAVWDVVEKESPFRAAVDRELNGILRHPYTRRASHGKLRTLKNTYRDTDARPIHWLTEDAENVETMKTFVTMVRSMYPAYSVKTEILETGEPLISLKEANVRIELPYGFPVKGPRLTTVSGRELSSANWEIGEESLVDTFGRWLAGSLPEVVALKKEQPQQAERPQKATLTIDAEIAADTPQQGTAEKPATPEPQQAGTQLDRFKLEGQVLSAYFKKTEFDWSVVDKQLAVSIIAYPSTTGRQAVIRLSMDTEFPETMPKVEYGYCQKGETPTPVDINANIEYHSLSELFPDAERVYRELIQWAPEVSILQAYALACLMLYYYADSQTRHCELSDYFAALLSDKEELKTRLYNITQSIKEKK